MHAFEMPGAFRLSVTAKSCEECPVWGAIIFILRSQIYVLGRVNTLPSLLIYVDSPNLSGLPAEPFPLSTYLGILLIEHAEDLCHVMKWVT